MVPPALETTRPLETAAVFRVWNHQPMQPSKADALKRVWNTPAAKKIRIQAVAVLKDPATQRILVRYKAELSDHLRKWQEARRADDSDRDDSATRRSYFGQRKLEARCRHMVTLLASFGEAAPDVAAVLAPVRASVAQVETALKVTAGLPIVKRKQAHFKIDDQLDEIERTVFAAVMGIPTDTDA